MSSRYKCQNILGALEKIKLVDFQNISGVIKRNLVQRWNLVDEILLEKP